MKLVGGDIGKYEKETFVDSVMIAPAERYIVEIYLPKSGAYNIKNSTPESNYTLGTIIISDKSVDTSYKNEFEIPRENKDIIADIDTFRPYFSKAVDKAITLDIDMK